MNIAAVETGDAEKTRALGERLARALCPGDVVALCGELGAGKTVFVQGLARGLGVSGVLVTSPSFVILHEYPGLLPLYHFDFYRLLREDEVRELGYLEYFEAEGVCAVEWADKFPGLFGPETLWASFSGADAWRRIEFCGSEGLARRRDEIERALASDKGAGAQGGN